MYFVNGFGSFKNSMDAQRPEGIDIVNKTTFVDISTK